MSVAGSAVVLMAAYLVLTFGIRIAVSLRQTGTSGISSLGSAPPVEFLGGLLFLLAVILGGINPVLAVLDVVEIWDELDSTGVHVAGFTLCAIGIIGTFVAQMEMGASWRIGVDPEERTELVTGGVFGLSRNPIYAFMIVSWAGFALLVPTILAPIAGALLIVGLEIQVRLVEEPHMLRTHGEPYRAWAARVGRFMPGVGRLRST